MPNYLPRQSMQHKNYNFRNRQMLEINELQEGRFFFGFIDNALHVAVNNGENAFEPSLFSEIDKSELAVLNHQIKPIQQLVDVLWLAKE